MELKGNLIVKLKPGQSKTTHHGVVVKNMSDFTAKILINESVLKAVSQDNTTEGTSDERNV